MPKVSVLMPVYNGECCLREAIDSILSQTFTDFEFIIVDDGSTDGTPDVLAVEHDPRVHVVRNDKNLGLIQSLNYGLEMARGQYVARTDADDVALPQRLEKQTAFMDQHPEVGILGGAYQVIDSTGRQQGMVQLPITDLQIRWTCLLGNPFAHPIVMLRRDVLTQNGLNYDEVHYAAEDYDLWTRMLRYTRGANLSEPLIQYRVHDASITSLQGAIMFREQDIIALRTIREQLPDFEVASKQVSQLRAMFIGGSDFAPDFDAQRVALAQLYLDMFEGFMELHPKEAGLKAMRCQEALRVACLALRPPLQPGWIRLVGRLITIEPTFPWSFWGLVLRAIARRLGRGTLDALIKVHYR